MKVLEIAVYHPQIPQNTGTLLRVSSCLGVKLNIIGPMGFIFDSKKLKRSGMDYIETAQYSIYKTFDEFVERKATARLVALELRNRSVPHTTFQYSEKDILIVGAEHDGFIRQDLDKINHRVAIPMQKCRRSLNMAIALTLVMGEAMRQLNYFSNLHMEI